MENPIQTRQWIGSVCESDHPPIFLEVVGSMRKPTIPFKFNSTWLKEASFHNLVKEHWIPYDHRSGVSPTIWFATSLKNVEKEVVEWAHNKRQRDDQDLK